MIKPIVNPLCAVLVSPALSSCLDKDVSQNGCFIYNIFNDPVTCDHVNCDHVTCDFAACGEKIHYKKRFIYVVLKYINIKNNSIE